MTEPPADEIYNPIQPHNLAAQYCSENYQSSTYSNLRNSMSDAIVPDSGYIDNLHIYNTTEDDLEIQDQNSASYPTSIEKNTPNSLTKPKIGQNFMNQRNKESIRELSNNNFNSKYIL